VSERKWDWPDTPTGQRNMETLSALARAIGMAAPGRFVLLLAKCNLPVQREALTVRLREMLEPLGVDLVEVDMGEITDDLLNHLKARLEPAGHRPEPVAGQLSAQPHLVAVMAEPRASYASHPPLALSIYGIEALLRSGDPHPPLLGHLNLARERYRELGCPLVLWLPDYALTRLAQEAPDFWAWRSGVFEFVPEPEVAESALRQVAYEPGMVTSSLDAAAKRERLTILEQLLADYRELGEGSRERDAQADILWKIGSLYQYLGKYETARRAYREALDIKQGLGKERGIAGLFQQLGNVAYLQGDYDGARRLYRESLDIKQQLNDRAGIAYTFGQLGNLAKAQGNLAEAQKLYEQVRNVSEELGDRQSIANAQHQLANLAYLQGKYPEAQRLYRESLNIRRQLGDRTGSARTLHQLGMLAHQQGNYSEAHRLYRKSLDTSRQLGDRTGVAKTLYQMGMLAQDQGDYEGARRLYQESLDTKQQLGDRAGVARTVHQLGMLAEEDGNLLKAEQFFTESLDIFEALGSPDAATIRRSLERVRQKRRQRDESQAEETP
jgi:tetratricopeptide (TPR) repeat protein